MAESLMGPATGLTNSKLALADADVAHVLEGKGFFAGDKILKTGKMKNNGHWPNPDKVAMYEDSLRVYKEDGYTEGGISIPGNMLGTADNSCVLVGRTYTSMYGLKSTGTMANNGAWNATIDPGTSIQIPYGYHNGNGRVTAGSISAQLKRTSVVKYCNPGDNKFTFTGGTLVGITYGGNSYDSSNFLQGVWIDGNTYHAQLSSSVGSYNVQFNLVYY